MKSTLKARSVEPFCIAAIVLAASISISTAANFLQSVSQLHSSFPPCATAGGDSGLPIISADGRYVLFASTANNLALMSNSASASASFPALINVFLRDRASNTTSLVSVNLAGLGGGNGDSFPAGISTNGQFALFESAASNLVANDTNNASDVFVRDLVDGTTFLASISTSGGAGNGVSRDSVMTPDGCYVAFVSAATNLVAGDVNKIPDVFVRDLQAGTTVLVSVGAKSTNSSVFTSSSEAPAITPDGHYVAFYSTATNLVPSVRTVGEIYVRDLIAGTTAWASTNARAIFQSVTGSTNGVSYNNTISDDGRFVAFETSTNSPATVPSRGIILRHDLQTGLTDVVHTNANVPLLSYENIHSLDMTPDGRFITFVANIGSPGTNTAVYLWDAQTSINTLVSGNLSDSLPANAICDSPSVSSNGQYVVFLSSGANLAANASGGFHIYVRDVQGGTTELVNADTNGIGAPLSSITTIGISADGRSVVFDSFASSFVAGDRNGASDVFVRDTTPDITELISAIHPTLFSITPNGPSGISSFSVNKDARFVAFTSDADDVTLNDSNGYRDVFLRDLIIGTNVLVSVDTNGVSANGVSIEPAISGDGRYVAFTSSADNLVPGDTNKAQDVFLRDLQTGTTALVSVSTDGIHSGNGASYSPAISADGNLVLFRSKANNVAPGSFTAGTENLFYRNMQSGTNGALTTAGLGVAAMTPDGRFIAFLARISAATPTNLYVWDSQLNAMVYTNTTAGISTAGLGISPDGNRLVYTTSVQLFGVDLGTKATALIGSVPAPPISGSLGLHFSDDGRYFVYAIGIPLSVRHIFLHDFQANTNLLVSHAYNSTSAANGISDSPNISADGRYVAYRSFASNIVAGDVNNFADLFVYDRLANTTALLTQNSAGNSAGSPALSRLIFSGNGRTLLFQSWASDLIGNDFNQNGDVFAFPFLYADVVAGNPTTISWPAVPGQIYRLQFKDSLAGSDWQDVSGSVTIIGNRAYMTDPAPASDQRFYRVVAE